MKNKFLARPERWFSNTIYVNDMVDIVTMACKSCYGKEISDDRQKNLNYINARIKTGHESIIEHSNIVMYFECDMTIPNMTAINEVLTHASYLKSKIVYKESITEHMAEEGPINRENASRICILLGGSIRGYKHVFREIKNPANTFLNYIKQNLYTCTDKEFFVDFIYDGIMDERFFANSFEAERNPLVEVPGTHVSVINIDPINQMMIKLFQLGVGEYFTYDDLLDMCTVTVLFTDLSRTATHQLVRHRNAITQESQRYVDYTNANFVCPYTYKPDYLGVRYKVTLGGHDYELTMKELEEFWRPVYGALKDQGVAKEDARAYLLSNTACHALYMTFTYRTLIKFLELRTDPAAQAEIRAHAVDLYDMFDNYTRPIIGDMYKYLIPKYRLTENDYSYEGIDEIVEEIFEEGELGDESI